MEFNIFEQDGHDRSEQYPSRLKYEQLPPEWQGHTRQKQFNAFLEESWKNRTMFYDDDDVSSKQQYVYFRDGGISAGQYVGTICYGGHILNIFPKVFKGAANAFDMSQLTDNLAIWLSYCDKNKFHFLNNDSQLRGRKLWTLFIPLYIRHVKKVIERHPFYQYEDQTQNLSTVRGRINFSDYATRKIPYGQNHKFLCQYSSFEFDNRLNRLIKCVCRMLFAYATSEDRRIINRIVTYLNDVSDVHCTAADCDAIHLDWAHRDYEMIVSMSRMFLLNRSFGYEQGRNKAYCFLFPMDKIFEGFVAGIVKQYVEECCVGGRVHSQANDVNFADSVSVESDSGVVHSFGSMFNLREDIYVTTDAERYVLDTKNKRLDSFESIVKRDDISSEISMSDLRQIKEYALKRELDTMGGKACLLYPMDMSEGAHSTVTFVKLRSNVHHSNASNYVDIHLVRVPFAIENSASNLAETLKKRIYVVLNKVFK